MKKEVYFHLGLPKTATTYLQLAVFPNLKGIYYTRKRLFGNYHDIIQSTNHAKYLFSNESDRNLDRKLDDINEKYPEAKIILVFRKHDSWINSKYKYEIRKHSPLSFKEFLDLENNTGKWKTDEMRYRNYIEMVKSRFNEPPLILNFEELKSDPNLFIKRITDYLGVVIDETNLKTDVIKRAMSEKQLRVARWFNKLYPYNASTHTNKHIRKIHYKYREFLLHTVSFLGYIIAGPFITHKPILSKDTRKNLNEFYNNDWEYCLNEMNK